MHFAAQCIDSLNGEKNLWGPNPRHIFTRLDGMEYLPASRLTPPAIAQFDLPTHPVFCHRAIRAMAQMPC